MVRCANALGGADGVPAAALAVRGVPIRGWAAEGSGVRATPAAVPARAAPWLLPPGIEDLVAIPALESDPGFTVAGSKAWRLALGVAKSTLSGILRRTETSNSLRFQLEEGVGCKRRTEQRGRGMVGRPRDAV